VGSACSGAAGCCNGLSCADPYSGDATTCAGGTCSCDACLPLGSACTAGGTSCCGGGAGCYDASNNGCLAGDPSCTCKPNPG
jgi:hypothetical protein